MPHTFEKLKPKTYKLKKKEETDVICQEIIELWKITKYHGVIYIPAN